MKTLLAALVAVALGVVPVAQARQATPPGGRYDVRHG